uniref:Uncharacterized protein n=1 Tax=Arundo donax TaxID=35708 RepID=A0A0A9CRS5_ARUDO
MSEQPEGYSALFLGSVMLYPSSKAGP